MLKRKNYRITAELVRKYIEFEPLFDELWYMGINTKRRLRLFCNGVRKLKKQGIDYQDPDKQEDAISFMGQLMKQIEVLPNGPLYPRPDTPIAKGE